MRRRVAATSFSPSAAPWQVSLPGVAGEPLPMIVLQQMSVGAASSRALLDRGARRARGSWPSTFGTTCQP
jgi:hypothetical protein